MGKMTLIDEGVVGAYFPPKSFSSEKEMSLYIQKNIKQFCKDVFNDDYVSHRVEPEKQRRFGARQPRPDLFIKCKRDSYIVELKNPRHLAEVLSGIGQLLSYGDRKAKLYLISSRVCLRTVGVLMVYDLPINFIIMNRGSFAELLKIARQPFTGMKQA